MTMDRERIIDEPKSNKDPKLIQEGDFQNDDILRVLLVILAKLRCMVSPSI